MAIQSLQTSSEWGRSGRGRLRAPVLPAAVLASGRLAPWFSPLIVLGLWSLLSHGGWFPVEIVAPPEKVAATALELTRSGELGRDLGHSLARLGIGYLIGAGLGLALGALMGMSRQAEAYLMPSFQLLRQLPTLALIPAFIMLFGVGETVKIVLVAKATALPVALATFDGVRGVPRAYIDVARVLQVRGLTLVSKVVLPAAIPPIVTGLRIALARSWMVLVGAELLVAGSGLGQRMEWGRQMFRIDIVLVGVVLTGLIGFVLDKSFRVAERTLIRWRA